MDEEIKYLELFLSENEKHLSEADISILQNQIKLMKDCNEKLHKTLLIIETDQSIKDKVKKDLEKHKGYTYV